MYEEVEEKEVTITLEDEKELEVEKQPEQEQVEVQTSELTYSNIVDEDEDELDDYGKSVQKRIKKLTQKVRYAERDKEEAVRVAEVIKKENDTLQEQVTNLNSGFIDEYGARLESQEATAKQALREALDANDADKIFDAQQAISKITIEQERHRLADEQRKQNVPRETPAVETPAPAPAQPARPDPKAEKWAERNDWFGENKIMTQAAFVIDQDLKTEGLNPDTDDYYEELDKRIIAEFPHKFNKQVNEGGSRVASASTSASRSSKQGRRTVKLSPSQVAMAKKLNVPLAEYAKYVKD